MQTLSLLQQVRHADIKLNTEYVLEAQPTHQISNVLLDNIQWHVDGINQAC